MPGRLPSAEIWTPVPGYAGLEVSGEQARLHGRLLPVRKVGPQLLVDIDGKAVAVDYLAELAGGPPGLKRRRRVRAPRMLGGPDPAKPPPIATPTPARTPTPTTTTRTRKKK